MTYERTHDCAECPQLHISEVGCPGRTVAIRGTTTIGRDNDNDIVLESMTVSRQHAMLLRDAAGLLLLDLDSTNGTLLNGVLAQPDAPVRLADGDELRLGQVLARYVAMSTDHGDTEYAAKETFVAPLCLCGEIDNHHYFSIMERNQFQ